MTTGVAGTLGIRGLDAGVDIIEDLGGLHHGLYLLLVRTVGHVDQAAVVVLTVIGWSHHWK